MKRMRFVLLIILSVFLVFSLFGCSKDEDKDLSEVFVKFDDKQITMLSQDTQKVYLLVTVQDGDSQAVLEAKTKIESNHTFVVTLDFITDVSYFSENVKITNVSIEKTEKAISDVGILLIVLGTIVGGIVGAIAFSYTVPVICEVISDYRNNKKNAKDKSKENNDVIEL